MIAVGEDDRLYVTLKKAGKVVSLKIIMVMAGLMIKKKLHQG
ncbi:MAG: hypothetical protein ACR2KB_15540 [Chitinophagaceae bacterium]